MPRLLEISQIGGRLVLLLRHQHALGAEVVALVADRDVALSVGADIFAPFRPRPAGAAEALGDRPGPGQRMVDHRDLVAQNVAVGAVEIEELLDDALVVGMQRNAARVVDARALEAAGLDLERVVMPAAGAVEPTADRQAAAE